jgi:DMSO/TMAO reductase YedYZ molybdopterin-dependent catalytic subunit
VGTAEWTGTKLSSLLEEAGVGAEAQEILFTGLDHGIDGGIEQDYQRSLPLTVALHDEVLLAWAMNGAPLEPQHGFPLRVVVPGWYGMAHVKWLSAITVLKTSFEGYQQSVVYRYSHSDENPGLPVTLMRVRSLLIPPGIPDFLTRARVVRRGVVDLQGRAWSGRTLITRVEVSCDGGATWDLADVGEPHGAYSWQSWRYRWEVSTPGYYTLCCRAYDRAGQVQPLEPYWTARGMGNNLIHQVGVWVVE